MQSKRRASLNNFRFGGSASEDSPSILEYTDKPHQFSYYVQEEVKMANASTPTVIENFGQVDLMYISIESTIALVSVLGNVLVVLVIGMNQTLRDPTFCFIVSLAMADIAVGTLVIPLAVVISLGLMTPFYSCLFISCLLVIITQSSILSLLAIAIDRFLRVKIPTRYNIIVTQRRAWLAVGLCWLLSFLAGLVPMAGWHHSPPGNISTVPIQCQFISVMRLDYMVYFNFFGWVVVPLTVMTGLYAEIFRVICRQLNRRAEATTTDSSKYYRKELKLAKSLALVLFLFALCWLPLHCMNCIVFFCPTCYVPKSAFYVGIFMSHGNSALNPLVYAFRIQRFRDTLIHIIQRFVLCKTSSTISSSHGPGTITEKTQVQM
ncbi:adenosine receptor A1 [Myxocyprinus asiaticus]|uniref:adenosine receptor A1 n=1 Tax=Myxocyprinus asiaticus TaxID=70543 RepID=UPI002221C7D6|nr:adenosine receptor A1 [Myxocyprinus asiaticus]